MVTNRSAAVPSTRIVEQVVKAVAPHCVICAGPVRDLQVFPSATGGFQLKLYCHRATETHDIPDEPAGATKAIPRRVFLGSVVRYGRVSPEARRERRGSR